MKINEKQIKILLEIKVFNFPQDEKFVLNVFNCICHMYIFMCEIYNKYLI